MTVMYAVTMPAGALDLPQALFFCQDKFFCKDRPVSASAVAYSRRCMS